MPETDVLAEIRAIRDVLAERYNCNAWALSRAFAERSLAAGRTTVRFPPRVPSPPRAAVVRPQSVISTGETILATDPGLAEQLVGVTPENLHAEWFAGPPAGAELL